MVWAAGIGISSVYAGLLVSYHYDTAAGPTVVLIATLLFFVVFTVRSLQRSSPGRVATATK
jgi:manganese/iron transport system permease protein